MNDPYVVGLASGQADRERSPLLSERAYQSLRHDILCGDVRAGEKLRIEVLQQVHSLSSSPLREALNRLVAEGLVNSDERRGFRVAPMSRSDLEDITTLRLLIEPEALSLSIQFGDDAWEGGVLAAYHRFQHAERRVGQDDAYEADEWAERHKAFHFALLAAAPGSRLLATCSSLFDQMERYRRLAAGNRQAPRDCDDEHSEIMQAALNHRPEIACALLKEHILKTKSILLEML